MEPTKPKLPREAVQLYNLFIHGEISRRKFMDGLKKFAGAGLTAAAIAQAQGLTAEARKHFKQARQRSASLLPSERAQLIQLNL